MLHCQQLLDGHCYLCTEVMAATSRYKHDSSKSVCYSESAHPAIKKQTSVQVRSLASETARQSEHSDGPTLAWFATDFQEEMSAFDGSLLVQLLHLLTCSPVKLLYKTMNGNYHIFCSRLILCTQFLASRQASERISKPTCPMQLSKLNSCSLQWGN